VEVSRNPDLVTEGMAELAAEIDLSADPGRSDLHDPAQRRRVEQQVTSIPGVLAVRLVPGFDREVDELHVVTSPERSPKATVRDVQTVLLARCGVNIDHRVISVVQLDERQVLPAAGRVRLLQVGTVQSGKGLVAEVSLAFDDEEARGSADGAATTAGYVRSVARATLAAFNDLIATDITLELRDAAIVAVGGQQLAVTVIELRDGRGEELRTGTALVREPAADAVARSVLAALNRTVETGGA
jgi:hypothetical protein